MSTKYILDMVHHNPGEPRFATRFLDPNHLADYGFNGQVFKHINCVATFAATGIDCFPAGSAERDWLDQFTQEIEREISAAKQRGLRVFYHLDLFVLPQRLIAAFKDEICDPATGKIALDRTKTLDLHRVLFEELTVRFPEVDGYIIRVGETYLFDTPFHAGNSPIPSTGPGWTPNYCYAETLAGQAPESPRWTRRQADAYVQLLQFLRAEVCVRHGRKVFFRTWDIFPDKLHAQRDHYLEVTDKIMPHENLAFSIKHTALDFWRRVKVNDCLGHGKHFQIVEVQCQREYEGKGAYPNYVMDGVVNGFEENAQPRGLRDWLKDPKILGVYGWSRGGGWYGPYIKNELWPDLNAYVLARFTANPSRSEEEIFYEYAHDRLGLTQADIHRFRELCLLSARAILKGRHCRVFDRMLEESLLPTACWMRDDRLGGYLQLEEVFDYLEKHHLYSEALEEKDQAVRLWEQIKLLAEKIQFPNAETGEFVSVSVEYGLRLYRVVAAGWRAMIAGRTTAEADNDLAAAVSAFDEAWSNYRALSTWPQCPTLYEGGYFNLPGQDSVAGLAESIHGLRTKLKSKRPRQLTAA